MMTLNQGYIVMCKKQNKTKQNKTKTKTNNKTKTSHFLFKFLLFFIVFRCLISFISVELLWVQAWSKALTCAFLPTFLLSIENSILPKMQIRPCCIHMTICLAKNKTKQNKTKQNKTKTKTNNKTKTNKTKQNKKQNKTKAK